MGHSLDLDHPSLKTLLPQLPAFDSFPYLVVRVVPALYQILLLPAEPPQGYLYALAYKQVTANRLPVCLTLDANSSLYFDGSGQSAFSASIPRGGSVVTSGLLAGWDDGDAIDPRRRSALRAYEAGLHPSNGYLLGDLTKGGRTATTAEWERLHGVNAFGVPKGLTKCLRCGLWQGECLDTNPEFAGNVIGVDCLCANQNRCANCGELLFSYKLNANYFDESDARTWHVPGFCGFGHQCPRPEVRRSTAATRIH